ncbi:alpha/beta fold hydrolase [Yinghuangia soli]|uniref:Alpha/beta hydrolase n=1 Tax=Yinghuangia soli TaxID=2908204 RepID=A0AA41Q9J5_9ACTN|nr:hypothetical protein [Yinghuangia soli]MCF2532854.1 hypothetical protein [Yinghuangia soli]
MREFLRTMVTGATPADIREANPRWSDADIDAEMAGFAHFDVALLDTAPDSAADYLPGPPARPSLVQLADPSLTIPPEAAAELERRGYQLHTVPGTGHCIHRDDLEGFLRSLDGWI